MQLPLEAATRVQFHEAELTTGDPDPHKWVFSHGVGAKGFYEGLARVYVTLADMAWSQEYWGDFDTVYLPPNWFLVDNPPEWLEPQEKNEAAETKATLDRIDALFVSLGVTNPMNPLRTATEPYPDGERREAYLDRSMSDDTQRVLKMTDALRHLMSQWVRQKVQEDSDARRTIYEIFSTDEIDSELLDEAEKMWNNLPQDKRHALEVQSFTQENPYAAKGLFRLTEALIDTLLNQSERLQVSQLEIELAVRVLDVFLFRYDMNDSLVSIRGNKNSSKDALDTIDIKKAKIRVPWRYNGGTKKYEFNCSNAKVMKSQYVKIKKPNPYSKTPQLERAERERRFWTRLSRIGGDMWRESRRGTTEAEEAEGSDLLCVVDDLHNIDAMIAKEKAKEAAAAEAKKKIAEANKIRLKQLKALSLVDPTKENVRKKKEEGEAKKQEEGLSERNLVMRGWKRGSRPGLLPNADGSQNRPWTWDDLTAAKANNGTNLEQHYREAVAILNTHAKKQDSEYLQKFNRREVEIATANEEADAATAAAATALAAAGTDGAALRAANVAVEAAAAKKKKRNRNQFKDYSWKEKNTNNTLKYQDIYDKINGSQYSTAWEFKNHDKKHFTAYQNRIAKDLWVRNYGHPLPPQKTCFPEKPANYYTDFDQRLGLVDEWMRGRMPRPLVPARGNKSAYKAISKEDIKKTDQLRCQAHKLMYIDFTLTSDPRMKWVHSEMLEVDQQNMQLEYETFMSEERRHIFDVLRACGPEVEAPLYGTPGCLDLCYDADKDSYALCAPEDQYAKEQAANLPKLYSYQRPCKDRVRVELDKDAAGGAIWTHPNPSRRKGDDAETQVSNARDLATAFGKERTQLNRKKMISEASQNNALIDVNEGKPCKYGTMPKPWDGAEYWSAFARLIEFDQELHVDQEYGKGKHASYKQKLLFSSFWGVYESQANGKGDKTAAEQAAEQWADQWTDQQKAKYDYNTTPGAWPQNPLTKKLTGEGIYEDGRTHQGDKGILKDILIEWVKAAEKADPNYVDDTGKWIGRNHASTFFKHQGEYFRLEANRNKVERDPKDANKFVPIHLDGIKTPIEFEPYYVAKYINCFQSDLVRCFPNPNPGGEGKDLNFNDIMDFICWYTTNVWEPWPDSETAPKDLWDRLCQYACVPAVSTWRPSLDQEGVYTEGRHPGNYYTPTVLSERIIDNLRTLWRGVTFCKKALDYAVQNKDSILHKKYPAKETDKPKQKQAREYQTALRKHIRDKWCKLTEGACEEYAEDEDPVHDPNEDVLAGEGGNGSDAMEDENEGGASVGLSLLHGVIDGFNETPNEPPAVASNPNQTAPSRPRRDNQGPTAPEGEIIDILNRISDDDPELGKLVMIGTWKTSEELSRSYVSTPWDATAAQWRRIFEAAANSNRLAILMALGTRFPSGTRRNEFLLLLAEWLPSMKIVALNIGEMENVTLEAIDAIYQALKHEDCLVGHLFFDLKYTDAGMIRKMKDAITLNRHKQGYYEQILRDEVFALGGANCWVNISQDHYARAASEVGKVSDAERANDIAASTIP